MCLDPIFVNNFVVLLGLFLVFGAPFAALASVASYDFEKISGWTAVKIIVTWSAAALIAGACLLTHVGKVL